MVSWGNLTEDKVTCYLRDILEALHYLHNSRIVHLDVKVCFGVCFTFSKGVLLINSDCVCVLTIKA